MSILCESFYFEKNRHDNLSYEMPYSFKKNESKFHNRLNYILNNALRFRELDTTQEKLLAREIYEVAIYILDLDLGSGKRPFNSIDENVVNKYYAFGQFYDFVNGKEKLLYDFDDKRITSSIYPGVLLARNEIKRRQDEEKRRQDEEQRLAKLRELGAKYIGSWESDFTNSKIYIYNNGTYKIVYTNEIYDAISTSNGYGTWDCTDNSISFTTTSGESVATMYSAFLGKNTVTFQYRDIFAPTLCLETSEGHVDFCFSHHRNE